MDVFSRLETAGPDEVLVRVSSALGRRLIGVGSLAALGLLLIWIGFSGSGPIFGRLILILLGALSVWIARHVWQASKQGLELTPTEVRESGGRVLCSVRDVKVVDRGLTAFKPSAGFLIRTHKPGPRTYAPGLWWRIGTRIGVGGLTNSGEAKAMAEVLQVLKARQDGQ